MLRYKLIRLLQFPYTKTYVLSELQRFGFAGLITVSWVEHQQHKLNLKIYKPNCIK